MNAEEGRASPRACLRATDAGWALALALAAALLYGATLQERLYGHDAVFLVNRFLEVTTGHSNSALYPLAAAAAGAVIPDGADPIAPLKWLSALGGALGVGATFLLARATGAPTRGAVFATLLLALAPAQWFFSTTIETHGLHVGAVGAVILITLFAPWQRPAIALLLVTLAFPLLYLTHMTALLVVPGWVFLVRLARARHGPVPSLLRDVAVVAPLLLGALLFAIAWANHLFGAGFTLLAAEESPGRFLGQFEGRFTSEMLWNGWMLPLFLLPAAAAAGLVGGRAPREVSGTLLVLVLPAMAVLLWASIPERGAYFLGSAAFLAALAAHAPLPAGARGLALAAFLVAAQAIAGFGETSAYDRFFSLSERIDVVRDTLGERGVLLTINPSAPKTSGFLPGVHDYDVSAALLEFEAQGRSPAAYAALLESEVRRVFPAHPVALDMSYRHLFEAPPSGELVARFEPYMAALEDRLQTSFETTYHPHPSWPILVLER